MNYLYRLNIDVTLKCKNLYMQTSTKTKQSCLKSPFQCSCFADKLLPPQGSPDPTWGLTALAHKHIAMLMLLYRLLRILASR